MLLDKPREDFVRLPDGAVLWTTTAGHGCPIILLNGGPGMADYLGPVAALLDDEYTVHRYEPRGCGRSSQQGPYTVAQAVADLEDMRRHWRHDRWTIIGHSWGVDLALAYALEKPGAVTAIVGLAGGRVHNDRSWHAAYDRNRHKEDMPDAAAPPNLDVNRTLTDDWRALCKSPDLLKCLSRLATRTLFIFPEDDIRPSWPTEQLSQLMSDAAYVLLANADHLLWRGNPAGLRTIMKNFLKDAAAQ